MNVGDICNREVVIARSDETVTDAARRMREFEVGDLVIVESRDGRNIPVAILTDRDIVVEVVAQAPERCSELTIADIATSPLVTAHADRNFVEVTQHMREHGIRRVPVVGADGTLVGILTFDDIVEFLAGELHELAHLVSRRGARKQRDRA